MLKKLLLIALVAALLPTARAVSTLPFYEPFPTNYGNGTLLRGGATAAVWDTGNSSTSLGAIVTNTAALSFSGLAISNGSFGLQISGTPASGRNAGATFTSQTLTNSNPTIYASFELNVVSPPAPTTNRLFAGLSTTAAATTSASGVAGVWVDSSSRLLISKNSSSGSTAPGTTGTAAISPGNHLVVLRYKWNPAANDDEVTLWLDPGALGLDEGSVPAATLTTTNGSDVSPIQSFWIFHPATASVAATLLLDEVRVGTSWAQVTPTGTIVPPSNSTPYITNAMLTADTLELSGTNGTPNAFYRVLAAANLATPQSAWPAIATNVFDESGNFVSASPVVAAAQFYRLLSPGGGAPPTISPPPQDTSVVVGQNALFSIGTGGTSPFGYQWYFNAGSLPGETNASLTVTNAQTDDAGNYSVKLSNAFGLATSPAALLTVIVPPSISAQPQSQTLSAGQDASFAVVANGSALLKYQWYFNTNIVLANATNTTLTLTNIQSVNAGKYSVIVTNHGGSVTSVLATLTVNTGPTAPTITTQPQDQTVTAGQSATFNVAASGSVPLFYRWYFNTNTPLNNATNASYTLAIPQTNNAGTYSVIVTNSLGSATSSIARLTVNPSNAANFNLIGYATVNGTVTGGAGGTTSTVTTAAAFISAVTSTAKQVVRVSGTITLTDNVKPKPNKTIIGLGTNAVINGDLDINNATNIIVQNLTFTNPNGVGDGDGVTIEINARQIWVDHCTFFDCADGQLDITHGSDFITVSWCKFYYTRNNNHNFVNLIGHSDNNATEDAGKLHVTFHHNWWSSMCIERMTRNRFGRVHLFNNYANCSGNNYCVRASIQSEVLVENNFYENISTPYAYFAPNGLLRATGNTTVNCSNVGSFNDPVFTPPYAYTLETPATAKANVLASSGAGSPLFP